MISKFILLSLIFGCVLNCAISQSFYSEKLPPGAIVKNLSMISFSDSVLLTYEGYSSGAQTKTSKWINPGSKAVPVFLKPEIIHITSHGGNYYHYYLEGKRDYLTLHAIVEDSSTKARTNSEKAIQLPDGIIISKFEKGNLFFLTYNKTNNQLLLTEVQGMDIVGEKVYNLISNLSKYFKDESGFGLYERYKPENTFSGHAPVKIFVSDNIQILIDKDSEIPGVKEGTLILTLGFDGSIRHESIDSDGDIQFSSHIVDNKLFSFIKASNKFILTVLDLTTKNVLAKKEIIKGQEDFYVYFRNGRDKLISDNETLKDMMKTAKACVPSISVIKSGNSYIIQCGTYFNSNGMMLPSGFNNFASVAGVLVMTVGTIIKQSMEPPGISRYFYVVFDSQVASLKYAEPNLSFTRKKIDEFEINSGKQKLRYSEKSYIPFKRGIIGLYLSLKKDQIEMVYFE